MRGRRRIASAAAIGLTSLSTSFAQTQNQQPTFRGGVEVSRVEVTVLDANRRPVHGLTAKDFTIKIDGIPQPIDAVSEIEIPPPPHGLADWQREVPSDVIVPVADPRLLVIILDDAITPPDPYQIVTTKKIASAIVDQMGPSDLAAVVFTEHNGAAVDFTQNRQQLLTAIDTFNPGPLDCRLSGPMSLDTLQAAVKYLAELPNQRRAIFYVSFGPSCIVKERIDQLGKADPADLGGLTFSEATANAIAATTELDHLKAVTAASTMTSVPIYAVSPSGLLPNALNPNGQFIPGRLPSPANNGILQVIARNSGGRTVLNTNAPQDVIPSLFEEQRSYYLVGYRSTVPRDGRFHRFSVRVDQRNATVLPDDQEVRLGPAPAAARKALTTSPLSAAIASLVPELSVPMTLGLAAFPGPHWTQHDAPAMLEVTTRLHVSAAEAPSAPDTVDLDLLLFDGEGRKQVAVVKRTIGIEAPAGSDGVQEFQINSALELKPGRYLVRVGAYSHRAQHAGSVTGTVEIEDFSKAAIAMSHVALRSASDVPTYDDFDASASLPTRASALRDFAAGAPLAASGTICSRPGDSSPLTLGYDLRDSADAIVWSAKTNAESGADGCVRFDQRIETPPLAAGDFLLSVRATGPGGAHEERDVRFTVHGGEGAIPDHGAGQRFLSSVH